MFENFEFMHPHFLWLLLVIPLLALWYYMKRNTNSSTLTIGNTKGFLLETSLLSKLKPVLYIFRLIAISLLIVALARPRNVSVSSRTKTNKGIDIVMAIDVSASMLARDLKPNRLEALKKVATQFVNQFLT